MNKKKSSLKVAYFMRVTPQMSADIEDLRHQMGISKGAVIRLLVGEALKGRQKRKAA